MKKTTFLYLFLTLAFVSPVTVLSETKFPPLLSSMGYGEVLTSWGPPSEKEAHETKRVDVWHYSGAKVLFREGRVYAWSVGSNPLERAQSKGDIQAEKEAAEKKARVAAHGGKQGDGVDDLLTEILKDVPSSEEGNSPPSAPAMPGGFTVPPPVTIDGE